MENNMERNQDNGRGMFYAVIGVATLIITIIGATFAYLTAATNSAANAVTASGAKIELTYNDVKTGLNTDLIPINEALPQFAKGTFSPTDGDPAYSFVGIDDIDCRDINGNNICSVYTFTVTNSTKVDVSQRVFVRMTPNVNTFTNLHYAVFKGTSAQVEATDVGFDVDGTVVSALETGNTEASRKHKIANAGDLVIKDTHLPKDNHNRITLAPLEQVLDKDESMTYTIVLWVHETGSAQDVDQDKNFAATISVDTGDAGTGVTGVLTAS